MRKYISFGELSYIHIILFLLPILTISSPLWVKRMPNNAKYNSVYIILNYIATLILSFFIVLILAISNTTRKRRSDKPPLTNAISRFILKRYWNFDNHLMLFFLSLIDFIRLFGLICLGTDDSFVVASVELRTTELIFMSFLSKYLLGSSLFKHHIVSIVLILIGICFAVVYAIETINGDFLYEVPLAIFFYFCMSLKCVCDKWMMEVRFYTPQLLLLYQGLYGAIISLTIFGCQHLLPCPDDWKYCGDNHNFTNIFNDFTVLFLNEQNLRLPVIVYIVLHSINNMLMMLINKYLSPCHKAVADSFAYFIWLAILFFTYKVNINPFAFTLFVIGYLLISFGSLVYNEVLILYFCDLDYNVKIKIMERGNNSLQSIEESNLLPQSRCE